MRVVCFYFVSVSLLHTEVYSV